MGLHLVMTTVLATATAAAPAPACSWAHPGADPFRGDPASVLADLGLPDDARAKLKAMMDAHRPSDVVRITRDAIAGDAGAYDDLREMRSGHGRVCHGAVDRSAWKPRHVERALVYCADRSCVAVPLACHNVALLTRRPPLAADDEPIDIEPAAGPRGGAPGTTTGGGPGEGALAGLPLPDLPIGVPLAPVEGVPGGGSEGGPGGDQPGGGPGPIVDVPPVQGGGPIVGTCCGGGGNSGGNGDNGGDTGGPLPVVPEPAAWRLLLAGGALLAAWHARSRGRAARSTR